MVGRRKVISAPTGGRFRRYHAATHVSASSRVSNTWTSVTGDVGMRLHEQDEPQVSGDVAWKGKAKGHRMAREAGPGVRILLARSASQAPAWRGSWRGTTAFPDYSELMRRKA